MGGQYTAADIATDAQTGQYSAADLAQSPQSDALTAHMSAHPGGAKQFFSDLENDLRYGGEQTSVGRFLKKAGYQGAESLGGMEGTAGKTLVSPLTGPTRVAQGLADPQIMRGTKSIASGLAETATIPSYFAAPEGAEAVAKTGQTLGEMIPSAKRAGQTFKAVMGQAKDVPIQLDNSQDAILKMIDWQKKAQLGPTVNKFLNRITNPKLGDLTYSEGRDFYQLLGRLSADETSKLPPTVKYDLTRMVVGLKQDIGNAAATVGQGENYYSAMKEFAKAKSLEELKQVAKDLLTREFVKGAAKGAGLGAGGALGYELYKKTQ